MPTLKRCRSGTIVDGLGVSTIGWRWRSGAGKVTGNCPTMKIILILLSRLHCSAVERHLTGNTTANSSRWRLVAPRTPYGMSVDGPATDAHLSELPRASSVPRSIACNDVRWACRRNRHRTWQAHRGWIATAPLDGDNCATNSSVIATVTN